jgi:hypothetical protein
VERNFQTVAHSLSGAYAVFSRESGPAWVPALVAGQGPQGAGVQAPGFAAGSWQADVQSPSAVALAGLTEADIHGPQGASAMPVAPLAGSPSAPWASQAPAPATTAPYLAIGQEAAGPISYSLDGSSYPGGDLAGEHSAGTGVLPQRRGSAHQTQADSLVEQVLEGVAPELATAAIPAVPQPSSPESATPHSAAWPSAQVAETPAPAPHQTADRALSLARQRALWLAQATRLADALFATDPVFGEPEVGTAAESDPLQPPVSQAMAIRDAAWADLVIADNPPPQPQAD